jgi:hypothetical protein
MAAGMSSLLRLGTGETAATMLVTGRRSGEDGNLIPSVILQIDPERL